MKFILVTNNPLVFQKSQQEPAIKNLSEIRYLEGQTYLDVLESVRDSVHKGHRLLTHPLSGSIKPNETPYKSVIVESTAAKMDLDSLGIIEESIQTVKKFMEIGNKVRSYTEKHHHDFMTIDRHIIESGIESINQFQ